MELGFHFLNSGILGQILRYAKFTDEKLQIYQRKLKIVPIVHYKDSSVHPPFDKVIYNKFLLPQGSKYDKISRVHYTMKKYQI